MTVAGADGAEPGVASPWSRAAALAAAAAISLALTLDPYLLSGASAARVHEGLPLLMLGVSSAFAYGLGFRTSSPPIRILTHPAAAWTMLGAGAALVFAR
jgi:predicted membrane protein